MRRALLAIALCLLPSIGWAALALDGTDSGTSTTTTVAGASGLTTTVGTDIVVAVVTTTVTTGSAPTVSSIAGCSLTWSLRKSTGSLGMASPDAGDVDVWYAKAAGTTCSTATVTATLSGTPARADIVIFAVSGANTTTPFDVNGTLPAVASSTSTTATPAASGVSTSNANALIFGITNRGNGHASGSGYSIIDNSGITSMANEYKIASSTQSSVTVTWGAGGTGLGWVMIADAIQQAGGAVLGNFFAFTPATVP